MKKHHHTHITRGAIFATAILIGGIATSFAGTATAGKGVIEKAEVNPLSFYDGKLVFDVQERLRLEIRDNNFDFSDVNTPTDDT